MRFTEINLLGVYVAPMAVMMVAAWFVTIALRRVASRFVVDDADRRALSSPWPRSTSNQSARWSARLEVARDFHAKERSP